MRAITVHLNEHGQPAGVTIDGQKLGPMLDVTVGWDGQPGGVVTLRMRGDVTVDRPAPAPVRLMT